MVGKELADLRLTVGRLLECWPKLVSHQQWVPGGTLEIGKVNACTKAMAAEVGAHGSGWSSGWMSRLAVGGLYTAGHGLWGKVNFVPTG